MVVWGGLTNTCEKKRSKMQRRKEKIYPFECRVPKNSQKSQESLPRWSVQEIEENNRMEKTRDFFKKITGTKGTFHAKIGTIKEWNGMDLTEAEDTKKRWQEYTEEQYKKDLHDPDTHDGVITHAESDILECKVKWSLGSINMNKWVEVMEFQLSYFKSWKMMLLRCCTQYTSKFGKLISVHRTGKGQFSFQSPKKAMPRNIKLPHNCTHLIC